MKVRQNDSSVRAGRTSNQRKIGTQVGVIALMGVTVIIILIINIMSTRQLKDTVEIAVFKSSMQQGALVTDENITKKAMIASEYWNAGKVELATGEQRTNIVLYSDRDRIVNTFTANYIRAETPLYWDYFTRSAPKSNSYLYEMDGELMKLSVSADVFGTMVMPGDRVNIRCKYTETTYSLPTQEEYEAMTAMGMELQTTETKMVTLFNEVAILDMLNSSGESIFDYYYNFVNLPVNQQQALLADDSFKSATAPSLILLSVTQEEADMYFALQDKSPVYMLTLLPRTESNLITEALDSLQSSNLATPSAQ